MRHSPRGSEILQRQERALPRSTAVHSATQGARESRGILLGARNPRQGRGSQPDSTRFVCHRRAHIKPRSSRREWRGRWSWQSKVTAVALLSPTSGHRTTTQRAGISLCMPSSGVVLWWPDIGPTFRSAFGASAVECGLPGFTAHVGVLLLGPPRACWRVGRGCRDDVVRWDGRTDNVLDRNTFARGVLGRSARQMHTEAQAPQRHQLQLLRDSHMFSDCLPATLAFMLTTAS